MGKGRACHPTSSPEPKHGVRGCGGVTMSKAARGCTVTVYRTLHTRTNLPTHAPTPPNLPATHQNPTLWTNALASNATSHKHPHCCLSCSAGGACPCCCCADVDADAEADSPLVAASAAPFFLSPAPEPPFLRPLSLGSLK